MGSMMPKWMHKGVGEYLAPNRREQFQIDRWMALHWTLEIKDRYFSAEKLNVSSPQTNPTSDFAATPHARRTIARHIRLRLEYLVDVILDACLFCLPLEMCEFVAEAHQILDLLPRYVRDTNKFKHLKFH